MCTVDGNRTIRTIKSRSNSSSSKCLSLAFNLASHPSRTHLGKVETRRPLRQVLNSVQISPTINGQEQVGEIFLFLLYTHFSRVQSVQHCAASPHSKLRSTHTLSFTQETTTKRKTSTRQLRNPPWDLAGFTELQNI